MAKKGERENLIGQRFGRLVVIELDENLTQLHGRGYWRCQCDCGNIHSVKACYLKNGMQKSCGCYKKEIVNNQHENGRKENIYIDHGEYVEGLDTNGKSFLFDKADYDLIVPHYWSVDKRGYAIKTDGQDHIKMHRYLLNPPKGYVTDHINHNRSDNRRCNLRIATPQQNAWNRRFGWNSTTGIKGVHATENGRFEAVINGTYIGTYDTIEQATFAREQAEEEIHKDFRYLPENDTGSNDYEND